MKIGLISDTHMPGSIAELWPQVYAAFADVEIILHGGDIYTHDLLDTLTDIAPVYVSRGNGDGNLTDDRVQDTWCLDLAGRKIGLVHRLPSPSRKSASFILERINTSFGCIPDIVVYGHTHLATLDVVDTVLCINPGSPTLPENKTLRHGTIGLLEIDDSNTSVSIHQITDQGMTQIDSVNQTLLPRP